MKYIPAPLEGMTGYLWRPIHAAVFGAAERYYTPFVSPNATEKFQTKELNELTRNGGLTVIPQVLTANPQHFLWAAERLVELGYGEMNLNTGCPSGTVVAKGKGSGMLRDTVALRRFFDAVFPALPQGMRLSVKTRIGIADEAEWEGILAVLGDYPFSECIVHPRLQKEFYRGRAHREAIAPAISQLSCPVVYNGDVFSSADAREVEALYPAVAGIMVGRGLMADPALLRRLSGGGAATRAELRRYHDALFESYCAALGSDLNAIYRMRELWNYLSGSFENTEKFLKAIRKAKGRGEYLSAVERLFAENDLRDGPRPPEGK